MTQKTLNAWLVQWFANTPAESVEDWYNRKGWLALVPSRGEGVLVAL